MFKPYEQGVESYQLDDLTLENQLDVINIYGNLQLYQDQYSLQQAQHLLTLMQNIVGHLQNLQQQNQLPEKVSLMESRWVENPFVE